MSISGEQPSFSVEDALRQGIGPEFDFHLGEMRKAEPGHFAVIKVGGATVRDDLDTLANTFTTLVQLGLPPVIVHGGGPQISADAAERGVTRQTDEEGHFITDEAMLGSVERGLGSVNDALVAALQARGVKARGITSGVFVNAGLKNGGKSGLVGTNPEVDVAQIDEAIAEGFVPIVSCLGQDKKGNTVNINGDTAGAALTVERQPLRSITLSDVPGVLDKSKQPISVLNDNETVEQMITDGTITDGMVPKVREVLDILHHLPEDSSVVFTRPEDLIRELFTHAGAGTLIRHGDSISRLASKEAADQRKIRQLIETAFGKRLIDDYFEKLPEDVEIFITDRDYRGVAIVIPGEEGQPAYMDKLVVDPAERGHGIGDELVDKVREAHPEGVYCRVRKDNKSIQWYRSPGRLQEYDWDAEWAIFFTEEIKPDARTLYAAKAALHEVTVEPIR